MQDANQRTAIINEWESKHCPPTLARSEHNFNVLGQAIAGVDPLTVEGLVKIVQELDAQRKLEHIYVAPAPEPNPEDNLPYPDEPSLRNIRCLADVQGLSAEKVRRFTQPAAVDSGLFQKFNERVAYLQKHRILGVPKPTAEEVASVAKEQRRSPQEEAILANVRASIAKFQSTNHGKTASIQQILNDEYNFLLKKGTSAKNIRLLIGAQIDKYSPNDSIR